MSGYSPWGTIREGRTVYHSHAGQPTFFKDALKGSCSLLLLIGVMSWIIIMNIESEREYFYKIDDLNTLIHDIRFIDKTNINSFTFNQNQPPIIHISDQYQSSVSDPSFNIKLKDSLALYRHTEYCQWSEVSHDSCESCTRTITAKDGSQATESYSCNCVRRYSYIKGWQNHLIPSFLFDQPIAHHNPDRDPFPSTIFYSNEASISLSLDPESDPEKAKGKGSNLKIWISPVLVSRLRVDHHFKRFVKWDYPHDNKFINNQPSSLWNLFGLLNSNNYNNNYRMENVLDLRDQLRSLSSSREFGGFVYIGSGLFFSKFEESSRASIAKFFLEYLEGSLFNWQIGDLIDSCTAGDIRISYSSFDPSTISLIGQIQPKSQSSNNNIGLNTLEYEITPFVRKAKGMNDEVIDRPIGLLHGGNLSPLVMFSLEISDAKWTVILMRVLLLIPSMVISNLFGFGCGHVRSWPSRVHSLFSVFAFQLLFQSFIWFEVWGRTMIIQTILIFIASLALIYFVIIASAPNMSNSNINFNSRIRNVWCYLAGWMGFPAEWRIPDSFINYNNMPSGSSNPKPD